MPKLPSIALVAFCFSAFGCRSVSDCGVILIYEKERKQFSEQITTVRNPEPLAELFGRVRLYGSSPTDENDHYRFECSLRVPRPIENLNVWVYVASEPGDHAGIELVSTDVAEGIVELPLVELLPNDVEYSEVRIWGSLRAINLK